MMTWRKSTYSGTGAQSDCVEVAGLGDNMIAVRDSKAPERHLLLRPETLRGLASRIKAGELDL